MIQLYKSLIEHKAKVKATKLEQQTSQDFPTT